jgi:hypothetical protein
MFVLCGSAAVVVSAERTKMSGRQAVLDGEKCVGRPEIKNRENRN